MLYLIQTKGMKMNLLTDLNQPILNYLTRIYRKNGQWVQTTRQYHQRGNK